MATWKELIVHSGLLNTIINLKCEHEVQGDVMAGGCGKYWRKQGVDMIKTKTYWVHV